MWCHATVLSPSVLQGRMPKWNELGWPYAVMAYWYLKSYAESCYTYCGEHLAHNTGQGVFCLPGSWVFFRHSGLCSVVAELLSVLEPVVESKLEAIAKPLNIKNPLTENFAYKRFQIYFLTHRYKSSKIINKKTVWLWYFSGHKTHGTCPDSKAPQDTIQSWMKSSFGCFFPKPQAVCLTCCCVQHFQLQQLVGDQFLEF